MRDLDAGVRAYYEEAYDEAGRLGGTPKGELEAVRLRALLSGQLPEGALVADVGGGPGAHAQWLREKGHEVHLLDPLEAHVRAAEERGVKALVGDARALPWDAGMFNAALLFGPMYHLRVPGDRRRALLEARRVLEPGGLVAVTTLNRMAPLIGSAIANNLAERQQEIADIVATGKTGRSGNPFVNCAYYHTRDEVEAELVGAGFVDVEVMPIGGLGNWPLVVADRHFSGRELPATLTEPKLLDTAVLAAVWTEAMPDLHVLSVQFVGLARKPG